MNLYETYSCIRKMESIKEKYLLYKNKIDDIKNKPINKSLKYIKGIIIILDVILLGRILFEYIRHEYYILNNFGMVYNFFNIITDTLYLMFVLFLLLCVNVLIFIIVTKIFTPILKSLINKIYKEDKINNYIIEQDKLNLEYFRLKDELENSIVPSKYRTIDILEFMIEAFETQRASTIKELVNLYEENLRRNEENKKINELIEGNKEALNEIKLQNEKNLKLIKKSIKETKKGLFRV